MSTYSGCHCIGGDAIEEWRVADRWMSELQNSIGNIEARLCVSRDLELYISPPPIQEPHDEISASHGYVPIQWVLFGIFILIKI